MTTDKVLISEIWRRLSRSGNLDGLPLGTRGGRIDLRNLVLPDPEVSRVFRFAGTPVTELKKLAEFRNVEWMNIDFTGSELRSMRFFDAKIRNCLFDNCQMQDLRIWSTVIDESSLKATNLKDSSLGAVQNGRRNTFSGVDFSGADLRGAGFNAASFERCLFRNTRLVKIDFQSSTFKDCQFEGELRDVIFSRRGFKGEALPQNEMINVDFTRAKFWAVQFRDLKLDRVTLPQDDEHILITNFVPTLNRVLEVLKQHGDKTARKLAAFIGIDLKWAAPDQVQGVMNIRDLAEVVGDEGVARFIAVLDQVEMGGRVLHP
jgi:uncharacterized protein YjbI with pentapeptide repeats